MEQPYNLKIEASKALDEVTERQMSSDDNVPQTIFVMEECSELIKELTK